MDSTSIRPGEKATVNCEIFGYPTSTLTWSFIPCPKAEFDPKSCDESNKTTFTVSVLLDLVILQQLNTTSTSIISLL